MELSAVVVPLMKGVIYQESDPALWQGLMNLRGAVSDYVKVMGLELILDEAEGYAFLRSQPQEDADTPRLIARRQLSYSVSLLLALLRRKLAELDAAGGSTRLILSREEICDMVRLFLPEGSNEARRVDRVDSDLTRIAELGFVRRLKGQEHMIEVRRILKAFVDAQWLSDFEQRLQAYRAHAEVA
ncbi:MAG: DUF4194 domain-containing protein [Candidatus Eremiobacterota bacterium]